MTTTESLTTTATVHSGKALAVLLKDSAVFADADKYAVHVLHAVQLRTSGDALIATGTDRFQMGRVRMAVTGTLDPFLLSLPDVKAVAGFLSSYQHEVTLTVEGDTLTVRTSSGGTMSARRVDGEFPAVDRLWPTEFVESAPGSFAVDPTKLARFVKVARKRSLKFYFQPPNSAGIPKGIMVTAGEDMQGLIMPLKPVETATDPEIWA